jgi:hypothetical protein
VLKQLTLDELLEMFDESVRGKIFEKLKPRLVKGMVVFENHDMSSSQLGARTACVFGTGFTFATAEECEGKWINDLPSQRQYAVAFYRKGE